MSTGNPRDKACHLSYESAKKKMIPFHDVRMIYLDPALFYSLFEEI